MRCRCDNINAKKIVVTTYGKDSIIEKFSISLYDDDTYNAESNADHYCTTINSLDLKGNSWIFAKIISDKTPYNVQQFIPYNFKNIILELEDKSLQKVI